VVERLHDGDFSADIDGQLIGLDIVLVEDLDCVCIREKQQKIGGNSTMNNADEYATCRQ
jgi:hypothetical protein